MLDTIRFDFDPTAASFGLSVRLETLALGGVIFLMLVLAALRAGRAHRPELEVVGGSRDSRGRLRRDDLILIAFGVVPGAVLGGRLDYALIHLDYYQANPSAVADPSQGGLALSLAVLFGTATGIAVARLLAAPIGRWLGVAGIPVLLGLGLGKLTMILGGAGQGNYSDTSYSTSYAGPGPWGSVNAGVSAVPSQAIEGGLILAAVALVLILPWILRLRVRPLWWLARPGWSPRHEWSLLTGGRGFLTLIALWAMARFAAAFTWRDAQVLGPFRAEQLVLAGVLAVMIVAATVPVVVKSLRRWLARRRAARASARSRAAAAAAADAAGEAAARRVTAAAADAATRAAAAKAAAAEETWTGEAATADTAHAADAAHAAHTADTAATDAATPAAGTAAPAPQPEPQTGTFT